jgi:hypothetical protein
MRLVNLFALALAYALLAEAQNPLKVDPEHYKVEFESNQVQVVRVYFDAHYKSVLNHTSSGCSGTKR